MAAPFVISACARTRLLISDARAATQSDVTAAALASLGNYKWSADVVQEGCHANNVLQPITSANFLYPGEKKPLSSSGGDFFAYSSGAYCRGLKQYCLPGTGGHGDWLGTQILVLDMTTGKYTRTEDSCRYGSMSGIGPDPGAVFQSTDGSGWRAWPNAAGRRSAAAGHTYGTVEYCPSIGKLMHKSHYSWPSAAATGGHYLVDAATMTWDQNHGFADKFGGQGYHHWIPSIRRTWVTGDNYNQSGVYDPLTNMFTATHRSDVSRAYPDFGSGGGGVGVGCTVEDWRNSGHKAYVYFAKVAMTPQNRESMCYFPRIDAGLIGEVSEFVNFSGEVPKPLQAATNGGIHQSVWIDGGTLKAGSRKIVIFDWFGGGIYLLDKGSWTFSGPVSGSVPYPFTPDKGGAHGFKCFFAMPDYSSSHYVAFGLIRPDATTGGRCYLFRMPASDL